jgi:hypothetical protein
LPGLIDADGFVSQTPAGRLAGDRQTIQLAAAGFSRVAAAGAHIIPLPTAAHLRPVGSTGELVLAEEPAGLIVVDPAPVEKITLDPITGEGEIGASALAVNIAKTDREALPLHAVRIALPRSVIKDRGIERIEAEVMVSLALGLGRAIDAELLAAILATSPDAVTNLPQGTAATAAARGLVWQELAAIIGTAGNAATMDGGRLYAGGIPAQLSADLAETVIGAFNRSAVVVADEIDLLIDRTDISGGVEITAWVGAQGLVADPAAFWLAGS